MPRQPLGTVIFQKGLLSAEQLLEALEEGHRSRRRLGDILLERGWLDAQALAETLADQYGLPVVELEPGDVDIEAARSISAHDADRLEAIVMRIEDGAPIVAVSDPSNAAALAELETMLGPDARFAVAAPSRIEAALRVVFAAGEARDAAVPDAEAPVTDESGAPDHFLASDASRAPGDEPARTPESVEDSEPDADGASAEQAPEWPPAAEAAVDYQDDADETPAADFATDTASEPEPEPELEPEPEPADALDEPEPAVALDELEPPAEAEVESDELSWAFAAVSEPAPSDFGLHERASWPQALVTQEHVVAPEDAALNGHAGEAAMAWAVVLRLAGGGSVEVGSFADRAAASARAAELIARLIADEPSSWTEIGGSHFRPQAIIAVEVVPAAA